MGTWGAEPFDNDAAADFAGDLDEADEAARGSLVREALEAALTEEGPLHGRTGDVAVAAAAIVAAQCPRGEPVDPVYGPEEPVPPLPVHLRRLAVLALDRVTGPDSDLPGLWGEGDTATEWHTRVRHLRSVLANATNSEPS
ncbi:DUF4259 domain-containing protein [Actinomadura fulvescens]|uniref:DUF4259 domain-containing protein n=1 Tax=Actinomadura fulvescens TaxID=46160 RepID=A0ABN3Q0Q7_9ACTN